MKKNIISTTVSKNFYIIFCNGKKVATFFVLFPKSHFDTGCELLSEFITFVIQDQEQKLGRKAKTDNFVVC